MTSNSVRVLFDLIEELEQEAEELVGEGKGYLPALLRDAAAALRLQVSDQNDRDENIKLEREIERLEKVDKAAFDFFAWYNRHYPETPSVHPDHPWCRLGKILMEADRHG